MNQKEVWNEIAPEWNIFRHKPMLEAREFLKDKKGNVLDLACGSGRNLIGNPGLKFYGVDFSEEMIKFAKINANKKQIKNEFSISTLDDLPFENSFFDSAIYIASLHCIPDEKKREKSLRELFRVLKPEAECLLTVWSKNHVKLVNHPKNATVTWKKGSEELYRYYYLYDEKELKELFEKVGFKIVSIKEDDKNIIAVVRKV